MQNFAPQATPPQPPGAGWVQMQPCPRCGQAIDPTKAVYSKQGELVCKGCETSDVIEEGYVRAAKSSCMGALGTGVLGLFFDFYCIISIAAVVQGVRAIILINRAEYRAVLKQRYAGYMIAAIGGTIAGLVRPAVTLLVIVFGVAIAAFR